MKRAPIVLGGTVAGLVGVLAFHTSPASTTLPAASSGAASGTASGTGSGTGQGAGASAAGASPKSSSGASGSGAAASGSGTAASGTRSATGPQVNYYYGVLSVKVTVSGSKITKVGIASLDDGGNPRSQFIDQQAIPMLEQEVMQAQSGSIQGISGASYTSAGFAQSLQSALHKLGLR